MDFNATNLKITPKQATSILEKWIEKPVECTEITGLLGGEIHSVFRLEFNCDPYKAVIKLRTFEDEGFEGEEDRLNYLRNKGIRVPQVFDIGSPNDLNPFSYILLEHLPGVTLESAELSGDERKSIEKILAEEVLKLHSNTHDVFGEINGRFATKQWKNIVVPRLIDMREEVDDKLSVDVLSEIDIALESAEKVFSESQSEPTLIHGDLWAGNIMVNKKDGKWQVSGFIDPGTQYADVEHELAYLQCFDTVGKKFFEIYNSHTPMRPGFELRKLYYWLNTMMIHVWLFNKPHYRERTANIAEEIVRKIQETP